MKEFNYSTNPNQIPWNDIQAVIFDIDGTLYNIKKFEQIALRKFLLHLMARPIYYKDYKIVKCYYNLLDKKLGLEVNDLPQLLSEETAQKLGYPVQVVKNIIQKWNKLLTPLIAKAKYHGLDDFFQILKKHHISRIIYSNMVVEEKMHYLALPSELQVSSLDKHIATLKPTAKGLTYILNQLNLAPHQCIFIGDNYQLDGKSAEMVSMPFIILPELPFYRKNPSAAYSVLMESFLMAKA